MIRLNLIAGLSVMLLIVPLLSSCTPSADTGAPEQAKNVTLIMKKKSGDYWNTVKMGAEAAAKEFSVNLKVTGPDYEGDVNSQIALIDQAVRDGMDALVLAANDYNVLGDTVDRVAAARIPVITIDSEVNSSKVRSFIGINNYDAGQQAGKKLIDLTGENGRIAVISFGQGDRNAAQREQGLLAAIALHPGIKVNKTEDCSLDVKRCNELTTQLLSEPNSIDGIVALDAAASVRVAAETDRTGLAGKVKVVTFDNTPEDIEFLQEGIIQATIIQNPFSMGYLGVKYAVDAMDGKKIPEFKDTGTKVIDQENMFWTDNQKLLFPFVK
ncbi:substrate-binding domain-containing protein [Paenibacillus sp. UNC451MF]|uniref:substrate-binding domain-containing protein n=1 Tax=Paenibacillus sp. UNC451MF TaxID=1449063 RepID=UPI000AAFEA90|nr:substrate-binding domain-containing protein [Paenibacillus sp. UNC451MF]